MGPCQSHPQRTMRVRASAKLMSPLLIPCHQSLGTLSVSTASRLFDSTQWPIRVLQEQSTHTDYLESICLLQDSM